MKYLAAAVCALALAPVQAARAVPTVVIVGDSLSKTVIVDGTPCGRGFAPCVRIMDGSKSYPAIVARDTGDVVINLAVRGSRIAATQTLGDQVIPSILDEQVPNVPPYADDVIFEAGTNDVATTGASLQTLALIDAAATAILRRAPHARLIFVGIRNFNGCAQAGIAVDTCRPGSVEAWNAREIALARRLHGGYVDMTKRWKAGASEAWPDGVHPAAATSAQIAELVEPLL